MKHDDACGGHDHDCEHDHDHDHDHDSAVPADEHSAQDHTIYSGSGVKFRHPRPWEIQEESNDEQTTITVQSPGTAFWSLSLFAGRPDPEQIVSSVMRAYRETYEELDVSEPDVLVQGVPVLTRELDFVCLDLVSTAALIVFQTTNHTVLVIYQAEDREMDSLRPVLEDMTRSLSCDLA